MDLFWDIYSRCTVAHRQVRTAEEETASVAIEAGERQGCLLSPIIFDLVLEPVIRAALHTGLGCNMEGQCVPLLAFADDLVVLEDVTARRASSSSWILWRSLVRGVGLLLTPLNVPVYTWTAEPAHDTLPHPSPSRVVSFLRWFRVRPTNTWAFLVTTM